MPGLAGLGKQQELVTSAGVIRYRERDDGRPASRRPRKRDRHVAPPPRMGGLVLTPCDAFDNFLPLGLEHLQLVGRSSPGLWLIGQSLRFRAIHRLPIAFGALTVRPIDPDAMRAYTEPPRTDAGVRHDFARLVPAVSIRHTREAPERLDSFDKPALVVWSAHDRLFPLRRRDPRLKR